MKCIDLILFTKKRGGKKREKKNKNNNNTFVHASIILSHLRIATAVGDGGCIL